MFYQLLHNRTVQALSGWIGVLSVPLGILSKMSPEWFGDLSWPQAILAGIAGALVVTLALSITVAISAFAYRTRRPFVPEAPPPLTPEENRAAAMNLAGKAGYEIGYEWDGYKAKIAALENSLETVAATVERLSQRLDGLRDGHRQLALDRLAAAIEERKSRANKLLENRDQNLENIKSEINLRDYWKSYNSGVFDLFRGLADTSKAEQLIADDIARITADAAYLQLEIGDGFDKGTTKRGWHIENAKIAREREFLNGLAAVRLNDQTLAILKRSLE